MSMRPWLRFLILLNALFLLSPILVVLGMSLTGDAFLEFPPSTISLRWYHVFFSSIEWRSSVGVSVEVALLATAIALVTGTPAAFSLMRSALPFKRSAFGLVSLPLIFPVVVSGVAMYYSFAQLHLVGTRLGLALAHATLSLPVVVLPMCAVLKRFDEVLEWQALTLGASPWIAFKTITFPILRVPMVTVVVFAFMTSFDEVVLALFLGSGQVVTVPKRIWEGLRFDLEPTIAVVSSLLIAVSTGVVLFAIFATDRLSNKKQDGAKP